MNEEVLFCSDTNKYQCMKLYSKLKKNKEKSFYTLPYRKWICRNFFTFINVPNFFIKYQKNVNMQTCILSKIIF